MSSKPHKKFAKRIARLLPDRAYIQLRYFSRFHRFARLRHPRTYNEKIQWLKLNYRVPGEWRLVDKVEVKEIVAAQIGAEYVIPTLAVYDHAQEIDFDALPAAFVLKCTHDSGGMMVVRDKSTIDRDAIRLKFDGYLNRNYFYTGREHHYNDITPRILIEPLIENSLAGQLRDYKFFCFDGEVKSLFVASDRQAGAVKFDYFDADYSVMELRQPYPNSAVRPTKPKRYDEMLSIARVLSKGHPHVRVDLYETDDRVYFGELTFYHFGGMQPFRPPEWDRTWGDWLTLPPRIRRGRSAVPKDGSVES